MMRTGRAPRGWFQVKPVRKRGAPGRECEHEGCTTVISVYNVSPKCFVHRPARMIGGGPNPQGKKVVL